MMDSSNLDKRIEFAEKKVLLAQARVMEQKEKANNLVKRLEREAKDQEEIKKEWIKKRNLEEERVRMEIADLKKAHRHSLEDLRVKYEKERENKLREVKILIQEEEKEIREWQKKRAEASLKTRAEEARIKELYQVKINALLKDEQSASRRGVVRQKRLLDAPSNVFSMTLERETTTGMKRKPMQKRFM